MRLSVAVLLALLVACNPPASPTPQTLRGKVYGSVSSGGKALSGAKVTARAGSETKTATTDAKGEFSLQLSTKPANFTFTAEPPTGSSYKALTYDNLPLQAYTSEFGAAGEFNVYLPGGTAASGAGFPPRFGCITGTLTDGGNPVVSNPAINNPPNRTSPATCNGSVPANLFLSQTALKHGENGLVLFGGLRAVTTNAGGNYLLPFVTTNNGWAFSGSLWAGNYTGTDTGNPATAFEYYWDKFAHIPTTDVFLNGSSQTQNLALEPFNPTTNSAKVTTLKVTPDTSALTGFNFADSNQGILVSIPSFNHAITSSAIELGLYFFEAPGSRNLRVPKLQNGKQGQQIEVRNVAINQVTGASSTATFWRDGTSLNSEVKADFLGIASPQAPANNATGVSRNPTLTWKAVSKARLYEVDIFQGNTLLWYGLTDKTSLAVPITLPANSKLSWEVLAYDQITLADAVGREPAALYLPALPDHPRLAGLKLSPAQEWAREQRAGGYRPNLEFGGINLKATGDRSSSSETFSFTTGQ